MTDAEAEATRLEPLDSKSRLTGKYPDNRKNWRSKEKGVAEDEMVRQHHQLSGHESETIPEDSAGQKSLVCCSPWGPRVGHDSVTAQQQPCIYSRNSICNLNFATKKVPAHMVSLANATKHLGKTFFYTDPSRK